MFEIYFCFNPPYYLLLNFCLQFNIDQKTTEREKCSYFFDLNRIFLHELTKNLAKKIKKHRTNGNHSSSNQQPKATNIKGRLKP